MNFSNSVTIAAPPDDLFRFVSDIERVAPCLPGAKIDGREGDNYLGSMRVKVGPIVALYQGKLQFLELDPDARRAVMTARATEVSGNGGAEAEIVTSIEEVEGGSVVHMETDLQVRGKVAQFGRGAMEKISERMMKQFAQNIEQSFSSPAESSGSPSSSNGSATDAAPATPARPSSIAGSTQAQTSGGAAPEEQRADALNALSLLDGDNAALIKRTAPIVLAVVAGFLYGYLFGRLRSVRGADR